MYLKAKSFLNSHYTLSRIKTYLVDSKTLKHPEMQLMQLIRLSLALTLLCLVPAEIAAALLSKTNKHSHADFVEAKASEFQAKEKNFVLVLREVKATKRREIV